MLLPPPHLSLMTMVQFNHQQLKEQLFVLHLQHLCSIATGCSKKFWKSKKNQIKNRQSLFNHFNLTDFFRDKKALNLEHVDC